MPLYLPGKCEQADMPIFARGCSKVVVTAMGRIWAVFLPRVLLTKDGAENLLKASRESDEYSGLQRLSALGSESPQIITELEVPRDIV